MVNINKNLLDDSDAFFDTYFENMNLNEDLEDIYKIITDDDAIEEYEKNTNLNNIRNENHKMYYDIKIDSFIKLPIEFNDMVKEIIIAYKVIDSKLLLTEDMKNATMHQQQLKDIHRKIIRLESLIKNELEKITRNNDLNQSCFSVQYFNNLDFSDDIKKELINRYNNLILYSPVLMEDIYKNINLQINIKNQIEEIQEIITKEERKRKQIKELAKLSELNQKISTQIEAYKSTINYLEDLILNNSQHLEDFKSFLNEYNGIFSYNKTNYQSAKNTYKVLSDNSRFKILTTDFEQKFIDERYKINKQQKFIYDKIGIKNLRKTLDYILANYVENLNFRDKEIVRNVCEELEKENYNLKNLNNPINAIVKKIWTTTVTNIYSYNSTNDFCFICSNNQFIDEKYETMLITKRILQRFDDYKDFQIGFICNYNENIMYITENEDIMSVGEEDLSNLKTPLQIEQEFINFKVCNKLALNGYKTKITAVYFIETGDKAKYLTAVNLANRSNLPLIILKKDN